MAKSSSEVQLLELKDMISQLNTTIKTLNETISRQQKENDELKYQLAWFRQKMFGSSSERRIDDFEGQLSLFDGMDEFGKPVELIPHSYVSESLLAYILYRKYSLYIPLYRQEKDFLQQAAPIGRTSMATWIIQSSQRYIQPMYDYFHQELLKRKFLMMDET